MRGLLLGSLLLLTAGSVQAADIFVDETVLQSGVTQQEADTVHDLVRNSISTAGGDKVVKSEGEADFTLQPRLMKLEDSYILTIERREGEEITYASQVKAESLTGLERAARRATLAAVNAPASGQQPEEQSVAGTTQEDQPQDAQQQEGSQSAATGEAADEQQQAQQQDEAAKKERPSIIDPEPARAFSATRPGAQLNPASRPYRHFTVGAGPFIPRRLNTDDLFYGLSVGHSWDVHPRASVKLLGEASFTTGDEDAYLYNLAAGGSYFFWPTNNGVAYVTGDVGYGLAQSAIDEDLDGFSVGTGVGFQFLRTDKTSLDLLLRYAILADEAEEEDFPQLVGVRLGVNF